MNTVALSYITYLYTAHYVVVSYILLLIVILLCSQLYVYIYIHATALYYCSLTLDTYLNMQEIRINLHTEGISN